jgi:hypothetical protein
MAQSRLPVSRPQESDVKKILVSAVLVWLAICTVTAVTVYLQPAMADGG